MLQTGGQLELEVRPLFLVPDTNGFIDHLSGLKKLLQCGTYIIVVPLIGETIGHTEGYQTVINSGCFLFFIICIFQLENKNIVCLSLSEIWGIRRHAWFLFQ